MIPVINDKLFKKDKYDVEHFFNKREARAIVKKFI
jgi:hypothetical protein